MNSEAFSHIGFYIRKFIAFIRLQFCYQIVLRTFEVGTMSHYMFWYFVLFIHSCDEFFLSIAAGIDTLLT